MLRRISGWALIVLGLFCALLGLVMAVVLGPDGRRTTGPHTVDIDGSVLVTSPRTIRWADVKIDVLVEVPAKKPVFVGLGNVVDVQDLVTEVQRHEVTAFKTPWKPTIVERDGEQPTVRGAPTALDWWLADSAGLGGASISTNLPDEPVSLAVIAIGASSLSGLKVTLAYGIAGGFYKGLGLLLIGFGGFMGGRILARGESALEAGDPTGSDDDVVEYIYVDEDGVEHHLTEAEIASGDYDVVDLDGVEDGAQADESAEADAVYIYVDEDGVEHEVTAEELQSGEFEVVGAEDPEPEPEPQPEHEPEPEPEAVYVWVDDDGVEHELTEAELAELGDDVEIIDDEDDSR